MKSYSQKAYISPYIIEEYTYAQPVIVGLSPFSGKKSIDKTPKIRSEFSVSRVRKHVRRIINANPELNKFLTLTFEDNVKDLKTANYEFKKFRQRFEYFTRQKLKYVAVPEFQKRGAVHFHVMLDIPRIAWQHYQEIWGNGRVKIEKIRSNRKTGSYMAKYISKAKYCDLRYFGKKAFFCSRNLKKCVQLVDNFYRQFKQFVYNKIKLVQTYNYARYGFNVTLNYYHILS